MKELSEFKNEILILRNLQRKMISVLTCEEEKKTVEIEQLFNYFDNISISNNFGVYESFLILFVKLSVAFSIPQKSESQFQTYLVILNELISKHSLKDSFHQSTLYFIFKSNKHFLLCLIKKGIIDISLVEEERGYGYLSKSCFLFFFPEIKASNPILYKQLKTKFMLTNKDIREIYIKSNVKTLSHSSSNDINMENIENLRKEAHSNEEINVIIRDDNIDSFVDYIYKNNLDLNSKMNESFLENNFYLMNSTSLLEYSMAFGSINIFRYLWMKKVYYSYYSLYFSIIGGNYEIIHILEEESRYKFDLELYNHSLEYYRPEICEYLLNLIQKKPISIYNIFVTSVVNEWEIIYKFLNEDEISNNVTFKQDNKSENNEIGKPSFSNDSNQSRFLNRLTYFRLDKTLCQYLFYHFVLQQSELNFIFKDGVYYLFFSKSFIQCMLKRSF